VTKGYTGGVSYKRIQQVTNRLWLRSGQDERVVQDRPCDAVARSHLHDGIVQVAANSGPAQ
jgi:hypothetical protein